MLQEHTILRFDDYDDMWYVKFALLVKCQLKIFPTISRLFEKNIPNKKHLEYRNLTSNNINLYEHRLQNQ